MIFFFFKQKTAYEIYQCDWSSDVCSSDLEEREAKKAYHAAMAAFKAEPLYIGKDMHVSYSTDRKSVV